MLEIATIRAKLLVAFSFLTLFVIGIGIPAVRRGLFN